MHVGSLLLSSLSLSVSLFLSFTLALSQEVESAKKALFTHRVSKAMRQEYKPHHAKFLRRKVAQLKTVVREREVAEGVLKRESKKADKYKRMANMYW